MRVYDEIAIQWDAYKQGPLPVLPLFLPSIQGSDRVLDAGCGNARNLLEIAKKASQVFGTDSSVEMLFHAKKNVAALRLSNVSLYRQDISKKSARLQPGSFDKILCLAVLHHLRTARERKSAFKEFSRLLKPAGLLMLSVWNKRQKRFQDGPADQLVPFTLSNGKKARRFYHFFEKEELEELARGAGFSVVESFYESRGAKTEMEGAANLCIVLKK